MQESLIAQRKLLKIKRPLDRIWIFCRQNEPGAENIVSVASQVCPLSREIFRRISAVPCKLSEVGLLGSRETCAVYISQISAFGCRKREGFCSLRVGSSETITGVSHWELSSDRRDTAMLTSAFPSQEPANQQQSRSPFSSSKRSGAWQLFHGFGIRDSTKFKAVSR